MHTVLGASMKIKAPFREPTSGAEGTTRPRQADSATRNHPASHTTGFCGDDHSRSVFYKREIIVCSGVVVRATEASVCSAVRQGIEAV
jgi:hypothetical protein